MDINFNQEDGDYSNSHPPIILTSSILYINIMLIFNC